jgi:hypothetical protein
MHENQSNWINWSRAFHQWGINEGIASILEGSGSFSLLAAQAIYLSQPILSGVISTHSLQAFAQMLENPTEKHAFISFLREAPSSGTSS